MLDKMKQLYEMQRKANELKKELESIRVEKTSKDGSVKVTVSGAMRVEDINIDPSRLTLEHKAMVEKSLRELLNQGFAEVQEKSSSRAAELMKGLQGLGIPGLS
jgi:DNA-binding YbaB/EbfC family protein